MIKYFLDGTNIHRTEIQILGFLNMKNTTFFGSKFIFMYSFLFLFLILLFLFYKCIYIFILFYISFFIFFYILFFILYLYYVIFYIYIYFVLHFVLLHLRKIWFLVHQIRFCKVKNNFQRKSNEDLKTIKSSNITLTPADKTSNLYKLAKDEYNHLLDNA